MLRQYQSMFSPVADIVQNFIELQPITTHPTFQNQWIYSLSEVNENLEKEVELGKDDMEKIKKIEAIYITALQLFLEKARNMSWSSKTLEEKENHVDSILNRPQIPQRTMEWYEQAQKLLTASEFSKLYGSEREYANLVLSKAFPQPIANVNPKFAAPTQEMNSFDWGIRFEPVVKNTFSKHWSVDIVDSGRIVHSKDAKVAASPDGILRHCIKNPEKTARLLEIKCPISRVINETIPFEYWCQMQIQMEVADIDECEYLEVKIESKTARQLEYKKPETSHFEGTIWLMNKDMEYRYAYIQEEKGKFETENWSVYETIPWSVAHYYHTVVQRDRKWFESTAPIREQFWKDVESARQGTFTVPKPLAPRKKACLIQDSPPNEAASITST